MQNEKWLLAFKKGWAYLLWVDKAENVHPREKPLLLLLPVLDKSLVALDGDEAPLVEVGGGPPPWPPAPPIAPGTASEDRKFVELVQANFICWRLPRKGCCGGVVQGLKLLILHM